MRMKWPPYETTLGQAGNILVIDRDLNRRCYHGIGKSLDK